MRVATYYKNSDVRLEEAAKPTIGPGELLVKVIASGICGSDVLEWYRVKKAPIVLGHEIAGEIVGVGEGEERYKIGDRVFVSHHVPCNTCHYCVNDHHTACETLHATNFFPGGFAEYIRVPKINVECGVFLLPKEVLFEEGTFIEPLGCVVRGERLAGLKPGQTLLILGSGISGLLHLLLARHSGAGKIITTDVNKYRLKMAKDLGADASLNAKDDILNSLRKINNGKLADLVIVCTGAFSAFKQALQCVDRGGTVLFFAATDPGVELPVPVNEFWRKEIKLMTSYGSAPLDNARALELIHKGHIPVRKLITHRLSLKEAGVGFRLVAEAGESIKVIIEPQK
ncbi:MAG: alcohol dehydrogenase catalytic domain-containing protein [Candidatus Omnitrophica bacterium]|nr:alcohol dehydrogenase catalytic domain-containing protein [Candidatus Omnitrophota bacterium]